MGRMKQRVTALISDIDAEIGRVQTQREEDLKRLAKKKAALEQMSLILTDEVEQAVDIMQRSGFLKELN